MLVSMACVAFAQSDSMRPTPTIVGAFASVAPTLAAARLVLPGFTDECGTLRDGRGLAVRGGLLVEFPLANLISFSVRPHVEVRSTRLQSTIPIALPVAREDGSVVDGAVDQRLDLQAFILALGAAVEYGIGSGWRIKTGLRLERHIGLNGSHAQVAIAPDNLLLSNNQRVLTLSEGELLNASTIGASIDIGASYSLPISERTWISPELLLSLPLTSESRDGELRTFGIHVGASMRTALTVRAVVPPPLPQPPRPAVAATIRTHPPVVSVTVTEYDSTEVLPLLNQVFFDQGSDAISRRYRTIDQEQALRFDKRDSMLREGSALDVYHQVLNIVGRRLQEQVGSTLRINGYRNGRELDPQLGLRRAESLRRYLVGVWGIAPRRISVMGGGLPPNPARESSEGGFEENARAELIPSDPNITGPWVRIHTQGIATPSSVVFFPNSTAEAGIARWSIHIVQRDSQPWRTLSGVGPPPDSIVWLWMSDEGSMPTYPLQLAYRFQIVDNAGQVGTTDLTPIDVSYVSSRQRLEHRENDSTVESFSLLLFNFDRPEVTAADGELLKAICSRIGSGARVRIIGYTDSLGDASYNRSLAAARARDAATIVRSLVPGDVHVVVDEEHGGEWERFPYSTPEGRSHCRTVFIEVRTPVKKDG